jgi:YggT family protein
MDTIQTTITVFVDIMILALMMKSTIDAREFFFNPILRPIGFLTEPVLKNLRRVFRPTSTGWDYTPIVAIGLLVLSEFLLFFLIVTQDIISAFIMCLRSILPFLLQVLTVCIIVSLLAAEHVMNPLSRFFIVLFKPFQMAFGFPFRNRVPRLVAGYAGIIFMALCVWQVTAALVPGNNIGKFLKIADPDFASMMTSSKIWIRSLIDVFIQAISTYKFIIFVLVMSAALSWANLDIRHPLAQFLYAISEPILIPIRRIVPSFGGLDLSPMIAIALIWVTCDRLIRVLQSLQLRVVGF